MYVDDNNQMFPYPRYQSNASVRGSGQSRMACTSPLIIQSSGEGDDVWFNALPSYVGRQALVSMGVRCKPINCLTTSNNIFTCPTVTAQAIAAIDMEAAVDKYDMSPGQRPLFDYGMNSKSVANENRRCQYVPQNQHGDTS